MMKTGAKPLSELPQFEEKEMFILSTHLVPDFSLTSENHILQKIKIGKMIKTVSRNMINQHHDDS